MSFLSPFLLWLLPLISIPVIIHFLNKRNIRIINFSSLLFLKKMEHESIRKLRILQILLLIIRTFMILMIILMMSRPVLKGLFTWVDDAESTFSAIIIDDSFSTRGMGDLIDRKEVKEASYQNILHSLNNHSMVCVSTLTGGIEFEGLKQNIPGSGLFDSESYLDGNFKDAFSEIMKSMDREYINRELFIISDGQSSNFSLTDFDDETMDNWNKFFIRLPDLNRNLAITDVDVVNEVTVPNVPVTIHVSAKNTGSVKMENVLLQLIFDGISVGQQIISLDVSESAVFEFQTAFHNTGLKQGIVELQADDRIGDNTFYFQIDIPRKLNIVLASDRIGEMLFIRNVILSINKSNELFTLEQIDDLGFQFNLDLRETDILICQGINEFSESSRKQINDLLRSGGHLIVFPGAGDNKIPDLSWLVPLQEGAERVNLGNETFQIMNFSNLESHLFAGIFRNNEKRDVKLFQYLELPPGKNTRLLAGKKSSIWNQYHLENGIVDIFGIAMDLGWTNFPLMGNYIPFWHMLLYSASDHMSEESIRVGDEWKLSLITGAIGNSLIHLSPDGISSVVRTTPENNISISSIMLPGFHQILSDGSVLGQKAVNISQNELNSPSLSDDEITEKFSQNIFIVDNDRPLEEIVTSARTGVELWKWFLTIFIVLMIVEMILSNVYGTKKH